MQDDQRIPIREPGGCIAQRLRNGLLKEGHNSPARVTEAHHWNLANTSVTKGGGAGLFEMFMQG
jgi:hypothetical protein